MGWGSYLVIVIIGFICFIFLYGWITSKWVTIHEYERGLVYARGRLKKVVGAGGYWAIKPFRFITVVDIRSKVASVAGQEILSADNVSVKFSLAIRYHVSKPELALHVAQSYEEALYLEAQLILRNLISALSIDDVLIKREDLARQLREQLELKATPLGLQLETVGIKDIMFPSGLKQIFAQVLEAKKSGQVSLEKARGEAASLRLLANAAKLLEGNPALVTLKTLQVASEGKNTLVWGVPQSVIPLHKEFDATTSGESSKSK